MTCKIGEKIRSLRLQHHLTQEQLADRLGVSYQSVSRWENGVTYPDIELVPAIARCFSASTDDLLGQDDANKRKRIKKRISDISDMTEQDSESLTEFIRLCRREQNGLEYFRDICYALRYTSLFQNANVMNELRKSKELFFEACSDAALRSEALGYYACLEEEGHVKALLDRYASESTTAKDYLLKERYLFRDEYDQFNSARQRHFHKQIAHLIDGDVSLWRDSTQPMDADYTLFENNAKAMLLHGLCQEAPTEQHPITCGKAPDVFAEQRIYIGLRQACAYAAKGHREQTYAVLEDTVSLIESVMATLDGAVLRCTSPVLNTLRITVKSHTADNIGRTKSLYYTLENGELECFGQLCPQMELECLTAANYARWGWLESIRLEERFLALAERVKKLIE